MKERGLDSVWRGDPAIARAMQAPTGMRGVVAAAFLLLAASQELPAQQPGAEAGNANRTYLPGSPGAVALIEEALRLGGDYLARGVDEHGKFAYQYDPVNDRAGSGYNLLRHAGAIYAMLGVYQQWPSPELAQAIERATGYLAGTVRPGIGDPPVGKVVVELEAAKLGGNALAVLALATYTEVLRDQRHLPLARDLALGMLPFRESSGYLRSRYLVDRKLWDFMFESEYYPGEAIFGLMRLYHADDDPAPKQRWLEFATRAAEYQIRVRDKDRPVEFLPPDHWLMYGLNELHQVDPRDEYRAHALKLAQAMMAGQNPGEGRPEWRGGYGDPPRTTPTSTRNEGLCAAHRLARRVGDPAVETIGAAIERGLHYQLSSHIWPEEAARYPNPTRALGGVRESDRDAMIQIDYVQHSLSALLCWRGQLTGR